MTRKKNPTKDAALLDALRSNMNLLGEIAMRYEVETQPERPKGDLPVINCPEDVRQVCWDQRWPRWPRNSFGCCSSTPRVEVVGQRVVYQGNVNSSHRPARRGAAVPPSWSQSPASSSAHNHPSAATPTPSPEDVMPSRRKLAAGRPSCWASSCWTTSSSAATGRSASRNGA